MRRNKRRPREIRLRGRLGRGVLIAALLHAQILGPLLIVTFMYAAREEAERPDEVDVAFRDIAPEDLPADLPSLDDLAAPRPKRSDRLKKRSSRPRQQVEAEPEIVVPPLPPMPPEPPQQPAPPERRAHEKMVDLDNDKEVEPPPDAKFLAQKNNRADVETRARDTNLDREQRGGEGSASPSERQDEQVGDEEAKIAELQDRKSALGKKAPAVTPHTHPELAQPDEGEAQPKSLLALRNAARREHELTPETADPSLPRASDGNLARPADRTRRSRQDDLVARSKAKRVRLQLSGKDYEYLFGADAAAERRLAQTQQSKKQGKFQKRLGRLQSALENFIPEVQPGNQTALTTRAAPFAAYIARMHRSIHRLWGFGMLEDWDEKSGTSPFNNPELLTTLEMVLNGDGTVDKITIVRPSGYLPYDVAAIDVAYSAGPYPDPPRAIRSANGKIYVHWRFYRDGRQCATSGADYFILDNPPAGGDVSPLSERPARGEGAGARATSESTSTADDGPRRLERNPTPSRIGSAQHQHREEDVAAAEERAAPQATPANLPRAENPAARRIAEAWFSAFARGDVNVMLGHAAYPFRSSDGIAASTRAQLQGMLKSLMDESASGTGGGGQVRLFTSAGLRGALGRMPPGLDDGSGMLFAVTATSGGESFVLALTQKIGGWKAVGLVRR